MLDDFSVGCLIGAIIAASIFAIAYASLRWRNGNSHDVPIDEQPRDTEADPDLSVAMIEFSMDRAAEQVVEHGLSLAERAAEFPPAMIWKMSGRYENEASELYVSPGLFYALERLAIASRARRGEKLTDIELGVLHGVIKPTRFRNDVLPELMISDDA
jgi:hypothetical protein